MSYGQVTNIFHRNGVQTSSNEVDGQMVRSYTFGDAIVLFAGDKSEDAAVIEKYPGSLQAPPL
jgi:hypothetical protein